MRTVTLKGSETHLDGSFLQPEDRALNFTLVNGDLETVTLDAFKHRTKVLATIPSIDTPVCSSETKALNDLSKAYPEIVFLVISKDLPFAQKRFCSAGDLKNVILLSDIRPTSTFGKNYGVLINSGPLAGLLTRSIILLAPNDKVLYSELVEEISNAPNFEELKNHLDASYKSS